VKPETDIINDNSRGDGGKVKGNKAATNTELGGFRGSPDIDIFAGA
jgi:hypothetical protein